MVGSGKVLEPPGACEWETHLAEGKEAMCAHVEWSCLGDSP